QKAAQDASASALPYTTTSPRLDSLDRQPDPAQPAAAASIAAPAAAQSDDALAATADVKEPTEAAKIRAGTARNAQASPEVVTITPRRHARASDRPREPVDPARMSPLPREPERGHVQEPQLA